MPRVGRFLALVLLLAQPAFAAGDSFLRTTWTTANGLPQNTVNAVVQTSDGYLWLGTNGGLARFDGLAFTIFTTANTPALKSDRILALREDSRGTLWIGTELGGIARETHGVFAAPLTTKEGLPSDRVFAFSEAPGGAMWTATSGGIAEIHDGRVARTYSSKTGMPTTDDDTNGVLADPDGTVWIGNNTGVFRLKDGAFTVIGKGNVANAHIRSLHRGPDGTLWVGMYSGLARVKDGVLDEVAAALDVVSGFATDANGIVWAASSKGLARIEGGTVNRLGPADGVGDMNVRAVGVDREGDVWIGHRTGGLSRWRDRPVDFISKDEGLAAASVLPVLADREGRVWAGAMCGGLSRLELGRWTVFGKRDGLEDLCVESLLEDRDGVLWIGTATGVTRFAGGRFTASTTALGLPPDRQTRALFEDRRGAVWIGTAVGLARHDASGLRMFTTRDGLVNDDVRFIMEDRAGGLWIGTVGGASRFAGGQFTNYTKATGLSNDFVRAIVEDADGAVWLGTYGGGLNRLKAGHLASITTKQGLAEDVVSAILEDRAGNFWMSGNRGVFRASRRDLDAVADGASTSVVTVAYGASDGMTVTETNGGAQPSATRTSDGRLWFATIGGIAVFNPERGPNRHAPLVAIEQVVINDVPVDPRTDSIDVPAGTRSVEIRYSGLSLAAPERVRFRYELEGYDAHPVEAGPRRAAYYTSLPPGRYRFRVTAANSDGIWNGTGAALAVRQLPRFYQTPWFYVLAVLGTVALAWSGYRVRLRHLVRRTRELERHVVARTAEVVERSNDLARANAQLEDANAVIAAARDDMLSTLNQLRLGVAVVDRKGRVVFLNRQARQLLDIDPDEPVEQSWDELLPLAPRDRSQLQATAQLPPARRTRLPVRVETLSRRSYWMEIDVHDDPRDPERRIFCLYDLSEVYDLRRLLDDKAQFHGLVGQSAAMQLVFKQIRDVAAVDTTVLIEGETGTGKELVARAVHYSSARKLRAFVAVNSAGLTESLLASQLFGHRRGAFTGAVADQIGLFESGAGGTVFLDEIGDVPLAIQSSLLRVLQEKEITRVGEHRPQKIDVRIVAATHRDLSQEVAEGRFRGDLLYRIRVARIQLPRLRDRREDIPLLVAWFLGQARAASRREHLEVAHETMDLLLEYSWPGNVRELKSAIESAVIRAIGTLIQPSDLPPEILADTAAVADALPLAVGSKQDVLDALVRAKGNRAAAARLLGIGRSTLYRRLRALGISDDEPTGA